MSKITQAFQSGKVFIPYIMAGDPSLEKTREFILQAQRAGADLIELGIPFSDPIAEGEIIQQASIRALQAGTTLDGVLDMLEGIKEQITIPVLLMTYLNPVFYYGYDRFFQRCVQSGVAGLIVPDLPFEEQAEVREVGCRYGVDLITLVAPTSQERIARIASQAQGFLYLVSSMGVTGERAQITTDIGAIVGDIRRQTQIPVAVGFGISTPEQAATYAALSDGVIVGSAIVRRIGQLGDEAGDFVYQYIHQMKQAVLQPDTARANC